ncbi:MAG TPA: putative porin [Gammaproteobacteria bacterium]
MRKLPAAAVLAALWLPTIASAQGSTEAEIAALRAEIEQLMERLERLERRTASEAVAEADTADGGTSQDDDEEGAIELDAARETSPRLAFSGDLRYRHESIDETGERSRNRHRVRARLGAEAVLADDLTVEFVLATGGDDPVSANQTLGSSFTRKDFGVDRAWFDWRPTDRMRVAGGKMPNPFHRPGEHHLIFDRDLNPEGLALGYGFGDWFVNVAGFVVEERGDAPDVLLFGGQLGYRTTLAGGARLTTGLSYYDYRATQGSAPFYDGAAAGNRLDPLGRYLSDFDDAEAFAELELDARGRPLTLFADYVVNTAAARDDSGFAVGARYGEVTGRGGWAFGWAYQALEADAVVGTFTDSDFAGGGTDNEGHVLEMSYGLRERWRLDARYFANRRGADAGAERDYDRLQIDVVFDY